MSHVYVYVTHVTCVCHHDVIVRKSLKFLKDQQYHQYYSNQPVYYQPMQGMSHDLF